MPSSWLLFLLILFVQTPTNKALFFGGGGSSCAPAPVCPTTCPVCSPCGGSFAYPSGGNNYGGIAAYPTQYAQQPSYGIAQPSINYVSQPVSSVVSQPASGYAKSSYVQTPQISAILPPLIAPPPSYSNSQPVFQQTYQAPPAPSYQGPAAPSYQGPAAPSYQAPLAQPISAPYSEQAIAQPTTTANYQPYNENPQTFEPQPTPQQVTPTRGYLDVDVQPVSATTYSPSSANYDNQVTQVQAATAPSTPQGYRDEDIDYLQPTGLEDPRNF